MQVVGWDLGWEIRRGKLRTFHRSVVVSGTTYISAFYEELSILILPGACRMRSLRFAARAYDSLSINSDTV